MDRRECTDPLLSVLAIIFTDHEKAHCHYWPKLVYSFLFFLFFYFFHFYYFIHLFIEFY
jgi:hypothetical protein